MYRTFDSKSDFSRSEQVHIAPDDGKVFDVSTLEV